MATRAWSSPDAERVALGVLDFALHFQPANAITSSHRVSRFVAQPFGLRLPDVAVEPGLLDRLPENLDVLIVTEPDSGNWAQPIQAAQAAGFRVLAEVTSRATAGEAIRAGADGLILSGHEAGGRISDESSFIFLQGMAPDSCPPLWVRGGIGPRSAAACLAAGAFGVVLDGAVLLARESPIPERLRDRLTRWDGSETTVIRQGTGHSFRVHAPLKSTVLEHLQAAAEQGGTVWEDALATQVGWRPDQACPVGQDAALAARLARRFVTVGGIVQAVDNAMEEATRKNPAARGLAAGSPLAQSHGTRYPIVQGPMTRVSDSPKFADAVAEAGALPFLALGLMRGPDVLALLRDTAERLDAKSWGVGILGFVPPELRAEQYEAIRTVRPPFALIAGGRPDQAQHLEREGIKTYLHVPSPELLRQFLKDGARRFVLEGRECGGHVGPRSSLVLWEQAFDILRESIDREVPAETLHVLFAGGIHDRRSAAAVEALAAPLVERGVKIGVLLGTAYLFTEEAVTTGAIVPGFQAEAVRCGHTVLLESGPGHEVRVSSTPFAQTFASERRRLQEEGHALDEIRETLERLNTGRLRIAAKGVDRSEGPGSPFRNVSPEDQQRQGVYMLGQVATIRDRVTTMAALHQEISGTDLAPGEESPKPSP